MSRAAAEAGLLPLQVSFKGALQMVQAFAAVLWTAEVEELAERMRRLREAIGEHRVGDRANRCEPRRRKRQPKHYPLLNEALPAAQRVAAAGPSAFGQQQLWLKSVPFVPDTLF